MSILSTKVDIRSLGEFVTGAWQWWKAEISVLLPPSLRERLFGAAEILTLDIYDETFVLRYFQGEACETLHEGRHAISGELAELMPQDVQRRLSQFRKFGVPLVLRIGHEHVLERRLSLPRVNPRALRHLLSFEIERQSPLPADEIVFDHRIEGKSGDGARIGVLLRIVKRDQVARARDICLKLVGEPSAVAPVGDLPPGDGTLFGFSRHIEPRVLMRRGLVPALFLAVLCLFGLNLQLFHSNREARIFAMEARLAEMKPEMEKALSLRNKIDQAEQRLAFSGKRGDGRLVIQLMEDLAAALPDGSWAQEIEYRKNELRLRGRSSDASGLLRIFEESASFGEAAFRAPVMAGRDGDADRFDLSLSLREDLTR
jgi:general secretion pathway protein L